MNFKTLYIGLILVPALLLFGQNSPSIKGDMPLWQRYMENSRNIKNGAAFIPLAVRMVIEQLNVTDHDDLYNLDIQIHLALKDMAFFKGLKEGTPEFRTVVNLTARKGDRIEMTIHPERKTIDLHVFGEIITFDVFDIRLKTLKWKELAGGGAVQPDEEFKIVAVIGEESLIIEKNFGIREIEPEIEETEFETVNVTEEKPAPRVLKPVFYYRENYLDLTASAYKADNHIEADLYGTHTIVKNDEKALFYRYLGSVVEDSFIGQLEFGGAWKYSGLVLSGSCNGGYNVKNNTPLFGLAGQIGRDNLALRLENSFFNTGNTVYEKNDLELTPLMQVSVLYNLLDFFDLEAGAFYRQNVVSLTGGLTSGDLYILEFLKYAFKQKTDFFTASTFKLDLNIDYLPDNEQLNWKAGLVYNYHIGKTGRDPLNSFFRSNRKAFSRE